MQLKTTLTLIAAAAALFAGQAFAASHAAKEDRAKVELKGHSAKYAVVEHEKARQIGGLFAGSRAP